MLDIRKLRTSLGYSFREFAYLIGVPSTSLDRAEKGEAQLSPKAMAIVEDLLDFKPGTGKLSMPCRKRLISRLTEKRESLFDSLKKRMQKFNTTEGKWIGARLDRESTFHLINKGLKYSEKDRQRIILLNKRACAESSPDFMVDVIEEKIFIEVIKNHIDMLDTVIHWFSRHSTWPDLPVRRKPFWKKWVRISRKVNSFGF